MEGHFYINIYVVRSLLLKKSQRSRPFGGNNLKKGQEKRRKCKGKGRNRKERSTKQREK
jgi:hypothetical protein